MNIGLFSSIHYLNLKYTIMKSLSIALLLIITVSCNNISTNETVLEQIELYKSDAIVVHDELMIQLGQLKLLKNKLQKMDSDSIFLDQRENIEFAIGTIDEADKSMWDWMHNFDVTYANEEDSVVLMYYESKLRSIEQVKLLFDSAISKANKMIN